MLRNLELNSKICVCFFFMTVRLNRSNCTGTIGILWETCVAQCTPMRIRSRNQSDSDVPQAHNATSRAHSEHHARAQLVLAHAASRNLTRSHCHFGCLLQPGGEVSGGPRKMQTPRSLSLQRWWRMRSSKAELESATGGMSRVLAECQCYPYSGLVACKRSPLSRTRSENGCQPRQASTDADDVRICVSSLGNAAQGKAQWPCKRKHVTCRPVQESPSGIARHVHHAKGNSVNGQLSERAPAARNQSTHDNTTSVPR